MWNGKMQFNRSVNLLIKQKEKEKKMEQFSFSAQFSSILYEILERKMFVFVMNFLCYRR